MDDIRSINLGSVYESVVCSELTAHGYTLFYYDNKKKGEVDFLINDYDTLTVIPLEVKSGKDYQIHAALDSLVAGQEHPVHTAIVLSNDRQVHEKAGILYLPVYFSMFLSPSTPKEVFF